MPYLDPKNRDAINVLLLAGEHIGDMNVVLKLFDLIDAADPIATIGQIKAIIRHYKSVEK